MSKNYLNNYNFYLISRIHEDPDSIHCFSVPLAEKYRKNKRKGIGLTLAISKKHKIGILVTCGDTELREDVNILTNQNARPSRLIRKIEIKEKFLLPYESSNSPHFSSYKIGGEGSTVNSWFKVIDDIYLKDIVFHMLDEIIKEERL